MAGQEPDPPGLMFYAEFEENGLQFKAYMPAGATQPQVWTIRVFREDSMVREVTVPMTYAPVFGPDAGDVAALEDASDQLLKELIAEN